MKNYDKDLFMEMIRDWKADRAPEMDDLEIDEPKLNEGKWTSTARDGKCAYLLQDDGAGNIVIRYDGTL